MNKFKVIGEILLAVIVSFCSRQREAVEGLVRRLVDTVAVPA